MACDFGVIFFATVAKTVSSFLATHLRRNNYLAEFLNHEEHEGLED